MDKPLGRCLAVLLLLLFSAWAAAQAPQARMPRNPGDLPPPLAQKLVIEGEWGYPCTLTNQCFPMLPDPAWVALEIAGWVGGERFLGGFTGGQVNEGLFTVTLEVPPHQRDQMVMLEVLAQSPDGHTVRFESIQGVAERLLAEAGSDERLPRTGLRPNGLTVLSTALVGLLRDANGGDWRMDEERFRAVLGHLDPARIMRHGVVLERILQGDWPGLGEFDPNALIASADAVDDYLLDLPGGPPQLRLFDSRSYPPYQRPSYDALNLTLLPATAPGTVAFGRRTGTRMRSNDRWMPGWYSLMQPGRRDEARAMFLIGNNDHRPTTIRVVLLDGPAVETRRIGYECPGEGSVWALRTAAHSHLDLWRLAVAAGMEFVEVEQLVEYSYEPIEGDSLPCVDDLPTFEYALSYHLAHRAGAPARAALGRLRSPFALQVLNPNPDPGEADSQFIAGVVDLRTGVVDVPGYASQGQVAVGSDGLLALSVDTLPDALRPGVVEMRFEPLRSDGLGAQEWMVTSRLSAPADDQVRSLVTPAVRVDPGMRLTRQRLDGIWGSGIDLSHPAVQDVATLAFDAASGQGVARLPGAADIPFSWQLEAGRMAASSFALDSDPGTLLPTCPPGSGACREVLRRVWQPLRMDTRGGLRRVYVIEEIWIEADDGLQRLSRALNFYDAS